MFQFSNGAFMANCGTWNFLNSWSVMSCGSVNFTTCPKVSQHGFCLYLLLHDTVEEQQSPCPSQQFSLLKRKVACSPLRWQIRSPMVSPMELNSTEKANVIWKNLATIINLNLNSLVFKLLHTKMYLHLISSLDFRHSRK